MDGLKLETPSFNLELHKDAYHGVAGQIINGIAPQSEAHPAALLIHFLVSFGNLLGRGAYYEVEKTKHFANLFAVVVGNSAMARKGTASKQIEWLMDQVFSEWQNKCQVTGLQSGEGLIYRTRDPSKRIEKGREVEDSGADDKRLLVVEPEFASVLKMSSRPGNILSPILRSAWDGSRLQILTKNTPHQATNTHISFVGHITEDELTKDLSSTEITNGLGNRFLWLYVHKTKNLPLGGNVEEDFSGVYEWLKEAAELGKQHRRVKWSPEAIEPWEVYYEVLGGDCYGTVGSLTSRGQAQVIRLALIYSVLDKSDDIKLEHLNAAYAVWRYSAQSVRHIFASTTGNKLADKIFKALQTSQYGLSRTDISRDVCSGNYSSKRIDEALAVLIDAKMICKSQCSESGRSVDLWMIDDFPLPPTNYTNFTNSEVQNS